MKSIVAILLTALLNFFLGIYFPWWFVAVAAFIAALLVIQKPSSAFLSGFFGIFLCWVIIAWSRNSSNEGILGSKIAEILPFQGSVLLLILASALIAGVVGGFAAMSASYFTQIKGEG
jgi:hypothetical protein